MKRTAGDDPASSSLAPRRSPSVSYVRAKLEGQDSNLHYEGQGLAVCRLTPSNEAGTAGLEPTTVSLTRSRSSVELHAIDADGWSRTTTAIGRRGYSALSSPMLSVHTR